MGSEGKGDFFVGINFCFIGSFFDIDIEADIVRWIFIGYCCKYRVFICIDWLFCYGGEVYVLL